ncbi:hypothetical protein SAMN04487820_10214 [Actinopolyspora mzabensis]|uniref:Uncharacterized protein n=1 Tax=Actinopolyspora mzabensis TaxID=995066 RepID=A0A1G8WFR3_ACTMZ|nr:hypothetical protein SAMN04487820_10214 [Actinopolyspora mzabensis]
MLISVLFCNSAVLTFAWPNRSTLVSYVLFTLGLLLLGALFAVSIRFKRGSGGNSSSPRRNVKAPYIFSLSVLFVGTLAAYTMFTVCLESGPWWMVPIPATGIGLYSGPIGPIFLTAIGKERLFPNVPGRKSTGLSLQSSEEQRRTNNQPCTKSSEQPK